VGIAIYLSLSFPIASIRNAKYIETTTAEAKNAAEKICRNENEQNESYFMDPQLFFVKDRRAAIFESTKEARNNSAASNLTIVENRKPPIKSSEEDTSIGWSSNSTNKSFERNCRRFIASFFIQPTKMKWPREPPDRAACVNLAPMNFASKEAAATSSSSNERILSRAANAIVVFRPAF
jgi:hypothetical protein